MKTIALFLALLGTSVALAQTESVATIKTSSWQKFKDRVGMNYTSFFDGPGLLNDRQSQTPNALGKPLDDGLGLGNYLSTKYIIKGDLAFDFQARFNYIMNNASGQSDFHPLRWQEPRVGISTTFFKTENSKLTGAFNTELPYSAPKPFGGGYLGTRRTTLATPGLFAKYAYAPTTSRWSIFSLVQPRFFIYKDRGAAEPQLMRSGYSPGLKPEFYLNFTPSINYAINDKLGTRIGTEFSYKKLVVSDWNPLHGSSRSADPNSKAWRMAPMPLQLGVTYIFSKALEVSTFVQGFPVSSQRYDSNGNSASFNDTVSAGAWISGVIF